MNLIIFFLFFFTIHIAAFAQNTHNPNFIPGIENETELMEHGRYNNKIGETVHAPAHSSNGLIPSGATAQCRDGEFSFSHTSSGTCSRHGGVSKWHR